MRGTRAFLRWTANAARRQFERAMAVASGVFTIACPRHYPPCGQSTVESREPTSDQRRHTHDRSSTHPVVHRSPAE
jgi:hypothetical protein